MKITTQPKQQKAATPQNQAAVAGVIKINKENVPNYTSRQNLPCRDVFFELN